jgi:hypothetical protein
MSALDSILFSMAAPNLLERTCEHILRLLCLSPVQAKQEVARVAGHPLLSHQSSLSLHRIHQSAVGG